MTKQELLHNWLRDAMGMEKALADYVEKSMKDFKDDETVRAKLQDVQQQNKSAEEKIEATLKARDDKPSVIKNFVGDALGFLSGAGSSMYHDDTVKNLLVMHGTFHFAHACYISLERAASTMDDDELVNMSKTLAKERKATAEWVESLIPDMSQKALQNAD